MAASSAHVAALGDKEALVHGPCQLAAAVTTESVKETILAREVAGDHGANACHHVVAIGLKQADPLVLRAEDATGCPLVGGSAMAGMATVDVSLLRAALATNNDVLNYNHPS